jgi:2,3,4,5-tetrahydropyridine-2,6-dicarboxylate N-succinyltransferase
MDELNIMQSVIERAWDDRSLLADPEVVRSIELVIAALDKGQLRVAEPDGEQWRVNEWVKKAVVLYFPIRKMERIEIGPFEFHDKMALKTGYDTLGVRVVPQGHVSGQDAHRQADRPVAHNHSRVLCRLTRRAQLL